MAISYYVKNNLWILQPGKGVTQLKNFHLNLGEAILFQDVKSKFLLPTSLNDIN